MPLLKATHHQRGLAGILLSGVLSAALVLAGTQGTHKANMNAYHADNKASIEEANQLMQSGLRYTNGLLQNATMLEAMLKRYDDNRQVVLACSVKTPIPETLVPKVLVENLWTPSSATQEVRIKAMFAPYDCDEQIDIDNFQVAFEITGSTGCKNSSAVNAEVCTARSVVMTAYKGEKYNPTITPPPETDQKDTDKERDKDKDKDKDKDDDRDKDRDSDSQKSEKPKKPKDPSRTRLNRKNVGL